MLSRSLFCMSKWMNEWMWWMMMMKKKKMPKADFIMVCRITRVGPTTGKKRRRSMFSFWHHMIMIKFQSVYLLFCHNAWNDGLLHHFLFRRVGFWLNNAVEGTTNIASVLGGYLSLFVVWEIDFLPPTTLMKPLRGVPLGIHLVLITLGYLIWSLFKQEWMLGFASGVCLRMGPFLLVFVFKVKAWLMPLISATLFLSSLCLDHFIRLLKK